MSKITAIYRRKTAQDILDKFAAVPNETEENYDFRAMCPVHEDGDGHSPSLLIRFYPEPGKAGTGRLDILCGSVGCDRDKIREKVGLAKSDAFDVPMGDVAFNAKRRGCSVRDGCSST